MVFWLLQVLLHLGNKYIDLILRPAKNVGKDSRRVRIDDLLLLDDLVSANLF